MRILAAFLLLSLAVTSFGKDPQERPASWAQPLSMPGLPNLHKVDDAIYRSAQMEEGAAESLKKLKIKTVICLREDNSDEEMLKGSGIEYVHIPMNPASLSEEKALEFLKIATNPAKAPLLFHCKAGADRTGAMCALYRITVQGWSKEDAVKEMRQGGYNFHWEWLNIPRFVKGFDHEKARRDLKLGAPPEVKRAPAESAFPDSAAEGAFAL